MSDLDEDMAVDADGYHAKEKRYAQLQLRRQWAKIKPISEIIALAWESEPVQGQPAGAWAKIGEFPPRRVVVGETIEGRDGPIFDRVVKSLGYKAAVEKWALWVWHTRRGTPVGDRDQYLTEPGFKPPTFVWEQTPPKPKVVAVETEADELAPVRRRRRRKRQNDEVQAA